MKIVNDPFKLIIQAVKELYPDTHANIQFNPMLGMTEEEIQQQIIELEEAGIDIEEVNFEESDVYGRTTFPNSGDLTPIIDISTNIPFEAMAETLAHELAHVVIFNKGLPMEHSSEWEEAFDEINKKYDEIGERLLGGEVF